MALTEAQIITALQLLGLPVRTDVTSTFASDPGLSAKAEIARYALMHLASQAQEDAVTAILGQYTPLMFDTDIINAQGLSSIAARSRRHLKQLLADTIGFTLPLSTGLKVRRG